MDVSQSSQTSLPGARAADVSNSGPLPLYDLHLRVLNDSYIALFNERLRIEETYRDNLFKLYQKQRAVDYLLDEKLAETGTLRRAWVDVLDSVERETEVRAALISSLSSEVIQPLIDLKETYERSRKRIKEDVKSSAQQYNDYVENTLPRLRRNYWRRCLDVDEYRQAMAPPPPIAAPTGPVISAPIPITAANASVMKAARDATATGNGGGHTAAVNGPPRARSPSATGTGSSFSDLAHQGKRQLNNLMSLIETKSGVKDKQDTRSEQALRGVKAKRDADDADREYRKGIHALETLRLRRAKILEAGFGSLETLVQESAEAVKKVLIKYSDDLTATYSTSSQIASHVQETIDYIFPEKDSQRLKQATATQLAASIPQPILYHNFHMGESKHLIMGISLVDYASARGLKDNAVPRIVELCIREVEARGLNAEGIYRISGRQASVFDLAQLVEKDEQVFQFNPKTDDVHCAAGLLKMYLRELPEPIFRVSQAERSQYTQDRDLHLANNMEFLRAKIRRLPPIHQATLRVLLEHLAKIILHQTQNRMDAKNLAVVFGPVVLGDEPLPPDVNVLSLAKDTVMEDMITQVRILYEGQGPSPRGKSSTLPAVPNNAIPAPITYGSSHTTVTIAPPPLPHRRPSLPTNSLAFPTTPGSPDSNDDFAQMPPLRPGLILHPSRHRKTPSASTNHSQGSRMLSRTSSEEAFSNGSSAKRAPTPMSPSSAGSSSSHRPPKLDLKLTAGNVVTPSRSPRLASPMVVAAATTNVVSAPVSVPPVMVAAPTPTTVDTEETNEVERAQEAQEDHLAQTVTIATLSSSSLPATPKTADTTHSFSTAITTPTTEIDGHELS